MHASKRSCWFKTQIDLNMCMYCSVPKEFVPQYPTHANPPTLLLVLHEILNK